MHEILRFGAIVLTIYCELLLLDVEKIIGWAISYHFMHSFEASTQDVKRVISAERFFSSFLDIFIMSTLVD
jgi:hypothetical protein